MVAQAANKKLPDTARSEATRELLRYRDQGLIIQRIKEGKMAMTLSGHCQFESAGSHAACKSAGCACPCHTEPKQFSGQGILFAVVDDRADMRPGKVSTVTIIADAIEAALDAGHETSEDIARYLTTSAFQHIPDKRVRFNSVLKAGDTVGAYILRKLYNSYDELKDTADKSRSPKEKTDLANEARGFAEALQVVLNPFTVEDPEDPTLVNWTEIDRMTEAFEKDRKYTREDRKKNPS